MKDNLFIKSLIILTLILTFCTRVWDYHDEFINICRNTNGSISVDYADSTNGIALINTKQRVILCF